MKQHIDTIPIWDAFRADTECPLCHIHRASEGAYVENFLGASVMEPSTRVEVNEKGFCLNHFQMMFSAGNRLGLALITDTYMRETIKKLAARASNQPSGKRSFFAKQGAAGSENGYADITDSCILCERLNNAMERYAYTIVHMWQHENEFRKAFLTSKGFCIPHFAQMLKTAPEHLNGKLLPEFIDEITKLETNSLNRVESDLEWFTLKFDYRNNDKPWGESRDAVERAILKLRGQMAGDKPDKKH